MVTSFKIGRLLQAFASTAALLAISSNLAAAQTWTGATSSDWTVAGNWTGGVPTNGVTIIDTTAPNPAVLGVSGAAAGTSGTLSVADLAASSGSLTIQNGSTLTSNATGFSYVGRFGGIGVVNVTGAGSNWTIAGVPGTVSFVLGRDSGTGTLNVSNSGSFVAAGDLVVGERAGGTGFMSITSGGTVSNGRDAYIARRIVGVSAGTATVTGVGSSWTIGASLSVANGGTGALTIANGARVSVATLTTVADTGGAGTLNINGGGTLETPSLTHAVGTTAQVNFDGGVLQARANNANFITGFSGTELNVAAGGLTINSVGFNVGINAASALTGVGGLTKTGTGTLSLSASNTYVGETVVQTGTLALTGAASIASSSRVVADATFDISALAGAGTSIRSLAGSGAVNLGTKSLTLTSSNDTFSGVIGGSGGLTLSSGAETLSGANTYTGGTTISAGTLQLGSGGTAGSIVGDVLNNGTLAFNRSDVATFAGLISGSGAVTQIGAGTTILTANNSNTGGTTISAGTLQLGSGGATGSIVGNVTNNGALSFNRSDAVTFAGLISGSGAINQIGSGTTILTANDSYTGGTTISAGTLQLGNGGTSGSIVGNVTNNGSLVFNRSDALAFGGVISGTGSVSQIGTGTTTLGGVNTYTGGTTITAGTLAGSATSFGSGAITDNAALVIDQPAEAVFANAINGTGSFTKQGAGRFNYTGTGTLSGATTVAAGLLSVNGSLANSAVTVQSGARLGGIGTVGATTVQSGGTIAPGNSIGTLQINGPYTQAAGSTYQVEVDPNTNASDRIAVTGTATLQSGAGLNVTKSVAGDYRVGTIYTVLTATGGRTGTYTLSGDTTQATAFLALRDTYDANNAYLTVVQTRDPVVVAETPNQQEVAENLPEPVITPVLNLPDDTAVRSAFDQLSAQALASAKGALVSNGLYVRDISLERLRDVRCETEENQRVHRPGCESDHPSLWAQGFGGWGGISGNTNASGLNRSAAGMLAGFDLPVMDWRAGLFAGFSNSDFHLTGGPAGGQSTDYHLGAYAGTNWDNINVSLGASYTWNAIRTDRSVAFGTFSDRLQATYNAGLMQVFAEVGYGMEMEGITLEPFANLAYLNLRTDGFSEVGGAAALTSQADTIENAITTFGIRPSMGVDLGSFPMTLRGMAGWRHTFGTITPTSTVAFAGGNNFTISGAPIARDAMALEAGFDFALAEYISAGLTYGGQLSSRSTDQTARGTLRVAF